MSCVYACSVQQQHWKHTLHGFPSPALLMYVFGHTRRCLLAEPAPFRCVSNADLDGPVVWPTGPVCGAWGVYFCGQPTAALLIWFHPWSDVMMAVHWWLHVSAVVFTFFQPWYFSGCVEGRGMDMVVRSLKLRTTYSLNFNSHFIIFFSLLKVNFGLWMNLTCISSQCNKTFKYPRRYFTAAQLLPVRHS